MKENKPKSFPRAVLLANLGTPAAPERKAVGRFLRQFLSDPRVVDLPRYLWIPLLYLVIVPLRAGRSAAAYREIWWPEGSPLLVLTRRLADRLAQSESPSFDVETGMRYGEPSIRSSLENMKSRGVQELTVLPLYPQYSGTTTASIYDAVEQSLAELGWQPRIRRIQDYFDHPAWVEAVAGSIREFRAKNGSAEKLIFSLHGIPQRYGAQGDPYESQCEASVAAIAARLGLGDGEWQLTYQSRVGREPWLQPYTDIVLKELGASGCRKVQVVCPGFSVDCLETLEEIAIQNRDFFQQAGGGELEYIPALNDSERHVGALRTIIGEAE